MNALIIGRPKTLAERIKEKTSNLVRQSVQLVKNVIPAVEHVVQHSVTIAVKKRQLKEVINTAKVKTMDTIKTLAPKIRQTLKKHLPSVVIILACILALNGIIDVIAWLGTWTVIATGLPVFPLFA